MPRPGPRPYECVRRAWHSDRHLPIRGSLIQEIFRVVNEIHGSATKKNKEWQEKLPVVVLKAEEIMYSKANSEAEYMDLKTLWDRMNDAINTIIRIDESTETGDQLQPCIEAALNLGCTPRKASRSRRNINPRCYLSPTTQNACTFSPGVVHGSVQPSHAVNLQCIPAYSNFMKPAIINPIRLSSKSQKLVCQNNNVPFNKLLFTTDNIPLTNNNQCMPMENYPVGSVYPLHYGKCPEPPYADGVPLKPVATTKEPGKAGLVKNLLSSDGDIPQKISQIEIKDCILNPSESGCDLSLRLGSFSSPLRIAENGHIEAAKDGAYRCALEGSQGSTFTNQMPQMDNQPFLFARVNATGPLDSRSSKLRVHVNVDSMMKKRKAACDNLVDDPQFCWQPKLPYNHVTGRLKSAGL